MEHQCNKQLWLERVLKKLYKKAYSLGPEEKKSNHLKKKINVPITPVNILNEHHKRKESCSQSHYKRKKSCSQSILNKHYKRKKSCSQSSPAAKKKKKRPPKKNYENTSKQEKSEHIEEKFWNFVDEFFETGSFEPRSKHGLFNSVTLPSTVTVWKSKGFRKSEMNSVGEETFIPNKSCVKMQKAQMRKATDVIAKEILEERNSKET